MFESFSLAPPHTDVSEKDNIRKKYRQELRKEASACRLYCYLLFSVFAVLTCSVGNQVPGT